MSDFELVGIADLQEHEEIDPRRLASLKEEIASAGAVREAIVADRATMIVLDGHHRLRSLAELGCVRVPVVFVEYFSPEIAVESWREGESVTKEEVIEAVAQGKKFPPKTTRHLVLNSEGEPVRISSAQDPVNVLLDLLR